MSGGTLSLETRRGWEDRMFNATYHHSCRNFDRCKYGVLNILNDPDGVKCCRVYGDSYLLLRNVRLRTTFASCDTSSAAVKLASCEYYAHVMETYTENELRAVVEVANRIRNFHDSTIIGVYKEIQIHGPVELSRDVEAAFIHSRHRTNATMCRLIEQFSARHKVNTIWMEPEDHGPGHAYMFGGGF